MAFPPGFLDELRARISLSGLIGRRVRLVRRGREYAGLCPFHQEKTPSFYVVEDKSFFHCFGCGAHGDAIGFLMRADNLDFLEAVERLAGETGLAVPQASREERAQAQRQKTLFEAYEAATAFYEARLWAPEGRAARDYLSARRVDDETIRRFRLGWAPDDRQGLRRALGGDFPESMLIEAGLLRAAERGEPFDYFRGRITFPIGDRAGRTIAFGGRLIGGDGKTGGQPKYLNSPEHPLFEKSRVLYCWSAARAARGQDVIVTEGYMDVIALQRAGFAGAVAPLGTALGEFQLRELWRLGPEPILCFDGDTAGQNAAARALQRALPLLGPGRSLRFAALPAGEDPDSLVRAAGRERFAEVLAAARPLCVMLWESEAAAKPADTPERRADLERRLMEKVGLIADRSVQAEYRRFVRDQLFRAASAKRSRPRAGLAPRPAFVRERPDTGHLAAPGRRQREILFGILLRYPDLIDEVAEGFAAVEIPEPELDKLRHEILKLAALRPGLDAPALRQHLLLSGFAATVDALVSPSVDTGFLVRTPDATSARNAWAHVIRMLMRGDASVASEALGQLIDEVSAERWARFVAVAEQTFRELPDDDGRA